MSYPGLFFFSVQLFCHLIETIFRFNWLLNQNVSNLYSEPTTKPLLIGEGELFILSLDNFILGFQTWFMDSFTPAYLKGNFKANWMLAESLWHIISWFSLTGHAMIGIQGRISQPVFCSTAHNSALKHMTIRNNCRFPETFWIWLANNHPQTICIHADTNFGELIRRMIDNFMTTRPILANCT